MATFPNPLQLTVGSDILVSHFKDESGGCGILFQMTAGEHKTGDLYPEEKLNLPHKPEPGELYIVFPTAQSAMVAMEALAHTMCDLMGFPSREEQMEKTIDELRAANKELAGKLLQFGPPDPPRPKSTEVA